MEFMETEFNQSVETLSNFEKSMEGRIKDFANIPKAFDDLLPGPKGIAIEAAKKRAIESTSSFFEKKQPEVVEKIGAINALISKTMYPLRSSIVPSEQSAGESQFQSALALVGSKNTNVILSELKFASTTKRYDFIFAVMELIKNDNSFNQDFKRQLVDIINSLPVAKDYGFLLCARENLNEIINQINYHRRSMSAGNISGSYAINRMIHESRDKTMNNILGRTTIPK